MIAHDGDTASQDFSWAALTGKREMRGSNGIGLHVACWIAEELGFAVVPMWPIAYQEGRKVPLEKWRDLEYRTPLEIRRDRKFRMKCGVAVLAGRSGLVVIDVDDEQAWDDFVGMQEMPPTMTLATHSGRQLIFRDDTGITYKTQGGQLAAGVDVRGRGGLFVVYDPGQPERRFTSLAEPAELPAWLRAAIPLAGTRGRGSAGTRPRVDIEAIVRGIPPGQHHDRLNALALALVNRGGIGDQEWYDLAVGVLARSGEGTDVLGNERAPFSDAEIMDFLHTAQSKRREEIAEKRANPGREYEDADITISAADVPDEDVEWIWSPYIARGSFTQLDGEKGYAKSFTLADVVARATTGRPMPGEDEAVCDPMNVFIFTEELLAQNKKKLRAAGADLSRVHYPHPEFREAILRMLEKKHGDSAAEAMEEAGATDLDYLLPTGTDLIIGMIRKAQAELVIWDPISHYVDADAVNTNSDPAVRRALEPLLRGLDSLNAAGIMVRHMNKDRGAAARHRGSGTTAFQNVGRVHLVMGKLADEFEDSGTFGLCMIANNYTVLVNGTLTFDLVDTDIKLDNLGHYVPKVEWHDLDEDIDAEALVRGSSQGDSGSGQRGPAPVKRQAVKRILIEMGERKQVWDAVEALAHVSKEMNEQGHGVPNIRTVRSAMRECMIESKRVGVGKNEWRWAGIKVPRERQ